MIDVVYMVVAIAVFTIGWLIAYARGYSAGHDDGFTEAALLVKKYVEGEFE